MNENANGISPVVAILITLIAAIFTVFLFVKGHMIWGVIFALVTLDFFGDVLLSLKKD